MSTPSKLTIENFIASLGPASPVRRETQTSQGIRRPSALAPPRSQEDEVASLRARITEQEREIKRLRLELNDSSNLVFLRFFGIFLVFLLISTAFSRLF